MRIAALLVGLSLVVCAGPARHIPVIYSTDLFHPYDDPDDHLDLATLFGIEEFDIKAVLLDQGDRQAKRPGSVPLGQMMRLTGRSVPFAVGLVDKLRSPEDDGRSQARDYQGAVELLLKTLRDSPEPVTIIEVGSVRDIVAAYNREPALLRSKVKAIYANIGNSSVGGEEWNVKLDPQAYIGFLRSGLPI
jgi:hypothetical protein